MYCEMGKCMMHWRIKCFHNLSLYPRSPTLCCSRGQRSEIMELKCDSTSSPQRFLWPVCQTNSVMGDLLPNWGPSQWEKMICGTAHISHPILPFLAPDRCGDSSAHPSHSHRGGGKVLNLAAGFENRVIVPPLN